MKTLLLFGDSYAGLSKQHLDVVGLAHDFVVDDSLQAGNRSALTWLVRHRDEIRAKAATLDPANTFVYMSVGGADALDLSHAWTGPEIASFLTQLHFEFRRFPIYHVGYEWWPGAAQNAGFERFYAAIREARWSTMFDWVEMRGVVRDPNYVDGLHLDEAGYHERVNWLRKTWIPEMVGW